MYARTIHYLYITQIRQTEHLVHGTNVLISKEKQTCTNKQSLEVGKSIAKITGNYNQPYHIHSLFN